MIRRHTISTLTAPLFPDPTRFRSLGAAASKADVRGEAAARGFTVAAKPDSYDICFIHDGDTRGWLAERIDLAPGDTIDGDGAVRSEEHTSELQSLMRIPYAVCCMNKLHTKR